MKKTKFDVFVVYSRKNEGEFVNLLLDRIDGLGVKVWNEGESIEDDSVFIDTTSDRVSAASDTS